MCAVPFAIPSRLLMVSLVSAFAGACAVGGCAKTPAITTEQVEIKEPAVAESRVPEVADESGQPERPSIRETPLGGVASMAARPVPVKTGAPPLVYLVETAQVVQVVDETAGLILAESPVRRRTIVRVDERNGVVAGREQLFAGPLPEGRRYGIYVVPDAENVSRSGRFSPRPSPRPMPADDR